MSTTLGSHGHSQNEAMLELANKDIRSAAFKKFIRFINYELVEGDILEFGVYTGRSLAILSHLNDQYYNNENAVNAAFRVDRTVYGLDSFEGLQETDGHLRWKKNMFKTNHSFHPTIKENELVTPEKVEEFFTSMGLAKPIIIKGFFDTLNLDDVSKVALCHIDCDLYQGTKDALTLIKDKLVDGSIIAFDDFFNNKGNPFKGEMKAYSEFLAENEHIHSETLEIYGTFCKAFVITLK